MAITGLILAGGRGSRMGGVDKGLQPFRGASMVTHVMRRLGPQVGALALNANQNLDIYRDFDLPVWPDRMEAFPGPLAGLQTGLHHCATEFLVSVPCDSPFLPMDLVARLGDALQAGATDAAFAVTGEGAARQRHPVFCMLRTSVLPRLDDYLQSGGRKMQMWLKSLDAAEVRFPDEAAFENINTLEDLRRFDTP